MKLYFFYNIYNEIQFIRQSLKSIKDIADEILIIDGRVKFFPGQSINSDDGTLEAISNLDDSFTKKIRIYHPNHLWESLLEKSQTAYKLIYNIANKDDWIFHMGGDEILIGHLELLKNELQSTQCDYLIVKLARDYNGKFGSYTRAVRIAKVTNNPIPLTSLGEMNPSRMIIPLCKTIMIEHREHLRNEKRKKQKKIYYQTRKK